MEHNLSEMFIIVIIPLLLFNLIIVVRIFEEWFNKNDSNEKLSSVYFINIRDAALVTLGLDVAPLMTNYFGFLSSIETGLFSHSLVPIILFTIHFLVLIFSISISRYIEEKSIFRRNRHIYLFLHMYLALIILMTNAMTVQQLIFGVLS